jgi:hydrogenase expression/formation protein HypE
MKRGIAGVTRPAHWAERAVRDSLEEVDFRAPGSERVPSAHEQKEEQVLQRIERARRRKPTLRDERITVA